MSETDLTYKPKQHDRNSEDIYDMNYNQVNVLTGLRKLEPNKRGVKPPAGGAKEDSQKTSEWAKQGSGILVRNSVDVPTHCSETDTTAVFGTGPPLGWKGFENLEHDQQQTHSQSQKSHVDAEESSCTTKII